jgi:sigma-E factor negative regulatory protein RseA
MVMDEGISRLVDGELQDDEIEAVWAALRRDEGLSTWVGYHVIGDTLRGSGPPIAGFSQRFAARLAAEPTVLAPKPRAARPESFAWAAAATVAAVGLVGWVAFSTLDPQATAVAKAREAALVRAAQVKPQIAPADFVLAHQEYSPTTQMLGVPSGVRTVSAPAAAAR